MKRILIGLLASAIYMIPAWAVEDNNPCQHKNMEFNRYIGSVTLSQTGSVDEQKGRCGAPVDVCALAKGVVSLTDTFKEELICSDCGEHTETQTPEGHSPKKVATHYLVGGDDPVTGAGTYRVSVGASCSCGACSLPSPIVITVTISHDYQEVEECDVSVIWYDQPGGPTPPEAIQNCTLTQSEARQQAGRLARVSGHCYTLKRCTSCEDEKSKTDHLSESTGASGGETAYNIYKRVKCEHYNDRKDYTITLRHNIGLKGGSQQGSCSFEGVPTEHSVQEQNVSVPVADTRTFNVAFNEKSHGNTKYTGYECSRCTLSRNFAEPLLVPHAPATELPPQTGSGELVDPQPQYPYQVKFNSVGETKVAFQHLCKTLSDRTLTHEGMTFEHIDVPGCSQSKAGEYEFAVKVMTVDKLAVTSEKGTAADTTLVLPELPDYEPEPAESVYVRAYKPETDDKPAQWETVLQATPTPAGEWPDGYPLWTRYPQYQGEAPDPLLLPVEDEPGKRLSHPSPGAYVIVARCGVNNKEVPGQEGLQPNPAHAKSLALYVVDPSSSVDFQPLPPGSWDAMLKASGNEKAKKSVMIASNGKTQPIRMILRVNRTGLKGRNATLKIKSREKESYAIYKDKECTDIFMKPGERSREQQVMLEELEDNPDTVELTLYFLPLLPDEEVAATLEYEDSSIDVEEPGEDKVMITGGCSSCVGDCIPLNGECGLGSVKVNFDLGPGKYGVPGGSVKVDSETLDYKLLGPDSFQVVAPATTEVKYNEDGYPVSADTGVYRTTFEYTVATVGEETEETKPIKFVNRVVIKTSGAEAELTLNYTVVDQLPKVTDLTVKNTVSGVVRNYRYECAEQSNSDFGEAVDVWSLTRWEGNNTAAAQTETVARKDAGDLRTEYRYTGPVSAPLIKEKQVKQKFADGEYEVIESRIGDAVTTYAYDANRNLTSVTEPDGSSTTYAYNADGELVSTTEKVGGLTTATTHAITDNGVQITSDTETKVNNVLTSRSRSVRHRNITTAPDTNTQYDESNTAYMAETYYVTDASSPFYGRVRMVKRSDGTVTLTEYQRDGSGTETETSWSGAPDSTAMPSSVVLGTKNVTVKDSAGRVQSVRTYHVENGAETLTGETVHTAFDSFGRATATRYLDGSTTSRTYGCCGVESETDRDGVTTTYGYDDLTRRLSYSTRDGVTTLYSYDAAGNQTAVTVKGRNGGELTTTNEYVNGELTATEDALGNRTTYAQTYSKSADVMTYTETVTGPDGGTQVTTTVDGALTGVSGTAVHPQSYEYGPNWQKTLPQNQTVYTDMLGRQYKTTYADGNSETQYYNAKQQLVRSVTPAGRATLYEYDALGRQVKQAVDMNGNNTIDADDLVTAAAYSYGTYEGKTVAITVQTRMQGAASTVISTARQSVDGLESWTTDMAGLTTHTKLERNGNGSVTQTVFNPDGSKLVTEMQNGRVVTVKQFNTDGTAGNVITYSYDEFNRQTGSVETVGGATVNTMTRTLDAAGRPVSETVNGRTTTYAYDIPNRKCTITQPGNRVVVEEYHPTGELKKLSGADTYTQEWTWDPVWGQKATLTTWKDASTPQVTTWTYDNRGNLSAKKYADDNGPSYTYDADGNLLTRTWARGVTTTYAYDPAGRITTRSYSDNTATQSLTLDYLNRALAITDASGTWNFTYDPKGWLVKETVPAMVNGEVIHGYDAYGRRTELRTASGSRTFTYDVQNRVASIGNSGGSLHYTYRSGLQQLDTASWRNGEGAELNSRTFAYDSYHRLTGIKLNGVSEVDYTLNDRDQRTAVQYPGVSWNYGYDDKGQLTGAEKSAGDVSETYSYTYDGIGNRLTTQEGAAQFSYASNLLNQYTQVNTAQPTYDADGNMLTTGDGWTYAWNGENRLVRAEKDGTVVEMNYDYAGRRFEKKVYVNSEAGTPGTLQHHYKYVYDGYKLVELYDNDTLLVSFTWQPESVGGLDVPVSMTYAGNTYSYVTDGNKNVTALLDAAGFRVAGYAYGPFGQVLSMDGALAEVNPFRFSSEFHDDETGLVYYNYRYYSPSLGRWTKRDPIGETGGLNLYGMVDGQLVNCFDNYGLISIYVHGVNSNHVGYDSLRSALKSRISMPTNMFEQYSIDMNWAISNGKGGFINPTLKASDSIGYPSNWFQGLSDQQWRAVAKLKKIAQQLRKVIKSDTAFCSETVNIVAHSQGTLISLAALQQGLKIDYAIFMGSPMDKEIVEDASHNTDIEAGARNTQEIINMWSTDDGTARIKGGIGGFGLPQNKISTKVIDIKLDRVDHFGKTGWWNGSWLDNGNNLKDTEGYWSKVLYTATDPSKLADKTKESIRKIQRSASSYMSR